MSGVGLISSSSNCYSNVVIQALNGIPKFKELILSLPEKSSKFLIEFKALLKEMSKRNTEPVNSKKFIDSCSWKPVVGSLHQDSNEFLLSLFNDLYTNKTKGFLDNLFEHKIVKTITSQDFDTPKKSIDSNWLLSLPIEGFDSFLGIWNDQFQTVPLSIIPATRRRKQQDNRYNMGTSDNPILVEAEINKFLDILPPLLLIHLSRFKFDFESKQTEKLQNSFDFLLKLDLRPFLSPESKVMFNNNKSDYELTGIIAHKGTAHHGHYVLYIRNQSQWTKYDDTKVSNVTESYILENLTKVGEIFHERSTRGGVMKIIKGYEETPYQLIYISNCSMDLLKLPTLSPASEEEGDGEEEGEREEENRREENETVPSSATSSLNEMMTILVQSNSNDIKALCMKGFLQLVQDTVTTELNLRPKMRFTPRNKVMPDIIFENDFQKDLHHNKMIDQMSSSLARVLLKSMEGNENSMDKIPNILPSIKWDHQDLKQVDEELYSLIIDPSTTWTHLDSKTKFPGECSMCHKMVPDTWGQDRQCKIRFCEDCHKGTLIKRQPKNTITKKYKNGRRQRPSTICSHPDCRDKGPERSTWIKSPFSHGSVCNTCYTRDLLQKHPKKRQRTSTVCPHPNCPTKGPKRSTWIKSPLGHGAVCNTCYKRDHKQANLSKTTQK